MTKLMQFIALAAVLGCFKPTTVKAQSWGPVEYCPRGQKAVGFQLKIQQRQGSGDDTALNAIRLTCTHGKRITSSQGPWGTWGQQFFCRPGRYLTSCRLRVLPPQGSGDDMGATDLDCKCNDGQILRGRGVLLGVWESWSGPCRNGILGIQTDVQKPQGSGDDTALNQAAFFCIHPM